MQWSLGTMLYIGIGAGIGVLASRFVRKPGRSRTARRVMNGIVICAAILSTVLLLASARML
jgi:hypothetical protein